MRILRGKIVPTSGQAKSTGRGIGARSTETDDPTGEENAVTIEQKQHEIWIEQCEAARMINERYGLKAAFDYIVGEKLINYAEAASQHPQFARSLPQFLSEVRRMFAPEDLRTNLARLERELLEKAGDEEGELFPENSTATARRVQRFTIIQDLLTAKISYLMKS